MKILTFTHPQFLYQVPEEGKNGEKKDVPHAPSGPSVTAANDTAAGALRESLPKPKKPIIPEPTPSPAPRPAATEAPQAPNKPARDPDREYATYNVPGEAPREVSRRRGFGGAWRTTDRNSIVADQTHIRQESSEPAPQPSPAPRPAATEAPQTPEKPNKQRPFKPQTAPEQPQQTPRPSERENFNKLDFEKSETPPPSTQTKNEKKEPESPQNTTSPAQENGEKHFTSEEIKAGKFTSPDGQSWEVPPGSTGATWEKTPNGGSRVTYGVDKKKPAEATPTPTAEATPTPTAEATPTPTAAPTLTPEAEAYKKKEAQFQAGLQSGTMTQQNAQGEYEFNDAGRKAFRELTLTEHEYAPGAMFSSATFGSDGMPTDPEKQERALQAQEKQFFKNYKTHGELAQAQSDTTLSTAQRVGSQEQKHLVNGGEENITFDTSKGIISGDDPDLSLEHWRNYDYNNRTNGYPKLTVFSEERDAGGRPRFSGTVVHPRDPKAQEIRENIARGRKYPNLYSTQMDVDGNGNLQQVFILPPSLRVYEGGAVSQSLGDVPVGPSKVTVIKKKKEEIKPLKFEQETFY